MKTDRYNLSGVITTEEGCKNALQNVDVLWRHTQKVCIVETLNACAARYLTFACHGTWHEKYICTYSEFVNDGIFVTLTARRHCKDQLEVSVFQIVVDAPNECLYVQRQLHGTSDVERITISFKEIVTTMFGDGPEAIDKDKFQTLQDWFWSVGRLVSEKEQAA